MREGKVFCFPARGLSGVLLRNQTRCSSTALQNASAYAARKLRQRFGVRRCSAAFNRLNSLTDPGGQEAPLVLQAHLAAGEKVCDSRDRLSIATRARADCQDEITQ